MNEHNENMTNQTQLNGQPTNQGAYPNSYQWQNQANVQGQYPQGQIPGQQFYAPPFTLQFVAPKDKGNATASLVLGIVSLAGAFIGLTIIPLVTAIIAIVFGVKARHHIPVGISEHGTATGGMVLGIVGIILQALKILMIIIIIICIANSDFYPDGGQNIFNMANTLSEIFKI